MDNGCYRTADVSGQPGEYVWNTLRVRSGDANFTGICILSKICSGRVYCDLCLSVSNCCPALPNRFHLLRSEFVFFLISCLTLVVAVGHVRGWGEGERTGRRFCLLLVLLQESETPGRKGCWLRGLNDKATNELCEQKRLGSMSPVSLLNCAWCWTPCVATVLSQQA